MKVYQERLIDGILMKYVSATPILLLEGAKGVGKTESCKRISKTVFSLDNRNQQEAISLNPDLLLRGERPVLVDEWHYLPDIWNFLRHKVDEGLAPESVILTGSNPRFHNDLHSGAGRIISLKLRPYSIDERRLSSDGIRISNFFEEDIKNIEGRTNLTIEDYVEEIYRSGFPGIRNMSTTIIPELLKGYIENIVTKEFAENGIVIKKPASLRAWLKAYAAAVSTTTSYQSIIEMAMTGSAENPSRPTANQYRNNLELLNIIEEVPSWLPLGSLTKNLVQTPKHFMVDPALVVELLGVGKEDLYFVPVSRAIGKFNKTFLGQLFESFVYQSLRVYADVMRADISHLRTRDGKREVDFIIQKGRCLLAFEVKTASSITNEDLRHLNWFESKVIDEYKVHKFAIYSGEMAYTRKDGVHVIPAGMMLY